jgi:Tol biopolymer transport system component/C-terminal processing protease CtpA/Prc
MRLAVLTLLLPVSILAQTSRDSIVPRPMLAEPTISPDRREIAFVSGGDIWTVPATGGEARLLISHAATESRPLYSPDGRRLAFTSTRTGNGDVYVLTFANGDLRRLSASDANDQVDGWSRDGEWVYFSSAHGDVAAMNDVYRVRAVGGTPMPVSADRYVNEFGSAPAPTGEAVALTTRGRASADWWRLGRSHIDETELWLMHEGRAPRWERITERGAKTMWPMWSADGRTMYYVSDRAGDGVNLDEDTPANQVIAANIWMHPIGGTARRLTSFPNGRVLWPSISADGRAIVFERDFRVWTMDLPAGEAKPVEIALRGAPAAAGTERLTLTTGVQEIALAPDGKKLAFIARGEVFAVASKDGGDATRVSTSPALESQLVWAPDSRRLVYTSDRDGVSHLFLYDFASRTETRLTSGAESDVSPRFSPDGTQIAFARGGRELRVLELSTKRERVVATGPMDRPPFVSDRPYAWSPDGRWIAYLTSAGNKQFTNVHIVAAAGGPSRQVSWLANSFANTVSWSPDGTYLLFDSGQRTESGELARIDLQPRTPRFREDQFRDLFDIQQPATTRATPPATPPARRDSLANVSDTARTGSAPRRTPVEIAFEGIRNRLTLVPVAVDVGSQVISPDGKSVLMIAGAAGQANLWLYSLDELAREQPVARQLTSTAGGKSSAQWSPDGKEVYYIEQGRIQILSIETRQARPLAVTAEMDVRFEEEKLAVFRQAWTWLNDNFYDSAFHGTDWTAARARYAPHVAGARTRDEMRRVIALMIGELNASHTGINPPAGSTVTSVGRLGARFDRADYERSGALRVTEIIPLGPAALAGGLETGMYLLAVDGQRLDARTNLDELLDRKIGRRVALTVARSAGGDGTREIAVRPINTATEKALLYRDWVERNRAYVERASNGRLGYVHMFDMTAASLAQLYVDLDAENHSRDGVVIDIRNNNGGFVNAYALDVFSRRPYLTMTPRGVGAAPARSQLGQRSLEAPTVLVVNQHSLSDAEDFTEGYRALGLGKVIGEPTAGWIIYTSNVPLVDGSVLRIPFIRITAADQTDMELKPRPVDIPVTRPIGEGVAGKDSQLDAAVRELIGALGQPKPRRP